MGVIVYVAPAVPASDMVPVLEQLLRVLMSVLLGAGTDFGGVW